MKSGITWRRTFPECAPGTDGVALFEGRHHRPGPALGRGAATPEAVDVESVTDPDLAGRPGWANTHGEIPLCRQAMDRLIERWQELRAGEPPF